MRSNLMPWCTIPSEMAKMLIGTALSMDVLKSPSLLSLSLHEEKLDIVQWIQHLLKSSKSLKSMAGQDSLNRPILKLICSTIKEENSVKLYQGVVLH